MINLGPIIVFHKHGELTGITEMQVLESSELLGREISHEPFHLLLEGWARQDDLVSEDLDAGLKEVFRSFFEFPVEIFT